MDKNFDLDILTNKEQYEVNTLILEQAADTAEKLTELECELKGVECYLTKKEGNSEVQYFTREGQEIFDKYYDEQVEQLYDLLNAQLKEIN